MAVVGLLADPLHLLLEEAQDVMAGPGQAHDCQVTPHLEIKIVTLETRREFARLELLPFPKVAILDVLDELQPLAAGKLGPEILIRQHRP